MTSGSHDADLLGVAPDATPAQIHAAYRRMVRVLHPDTGGTDDAETHQLLAELAAARARLLAPPPVAAAAPGEPAGDEYVEPLDADLDDELAFDVSNPHLADRIGVIMAVAVVVFGAFVLALAVVVLTQSG